MNDVRTDAAAHERSGGTHFPCLDAYRGIGMTMVLCNHAGYATGFIQNSSLGPYVARLDISVPMFFVMSGFLLFRPFARSILEGRPLTPTRTFYRRRALRILPSYWLALAGLGLTVGLKVASVKGWIGNVLLLPAFGVPVQVCDADRCRVSYGITQAWSIGVEATYYLLLPLFAVGLARIIRRQDARRRGPLLLAACAALYLAGAGFRVAVVALDPSFATESLLWLPMFLDLFAIGMGLAVISAVPADGARGLRSLLDSVGSHPAACWLVALGLFLLMAQFTPPSVPFGLNGREYVPRQLVYGIASGIWLLPAMFGDQGAGRLRAVLASRPLVYLGAVSLTFYLWHLAFVEQAKRWTVPGYDTATGLAVFRGNFLVVAAIAWTASLAVAAVLHRVVERPFIDLKDRPLTDLLRRG